jgi:hypothetical protein
VASGSEVPDVSGQKVAIGAGIGSLLECAFYLQIDAAKRLDHSYSALLCRRINLLRRSDPVLQSVAQVRPGAHNSILASPRDYLITRVARTSTLGGIVRPICFAAFRLMMNSNFIGCSTGRSAGVLPFRILSTYVAARRNKSAVFAP